MPGCFFCGFLLRERVCCLRQGASDLNPRLAGFGLMLGERRSARTGHPAEALINHGQSQASMRWLLTPASVSFT